MKKKRMDQRGPTDISLMASVIAMNARPGPDFNSSNATPGIVQQLVIRFSYENYWSFSKKVIMDSSCSASWVWTGYARLKYFHYVTLHNSP